MTTDVSDWQTEELELLRLVSLGLPNKTIASTFGVSETAVKKRLHRVMRRMGVENRAALVRVGFVRGLIAHGEDASR